MFNTSIQRWESSCWATIHQYGQTQRGLVFAHQQNNYLWLNDRNILYKIVRYWNVDSWVNVIDFKNKNFNQIFFLFSYFLSSHFAIIFTIKIEQTVFLLLPSVFLIWLLQQIWNICIFFCDVFLNLTNSLAIASKWIFLSINTSLLVKWGRHSLNVEGFLRRLRNHCTLGIPYFLLSSINFGLSFTVCWLLY